jgi:hypothetical protein
VSVTPIAGRFELFIALEGSGTIGGQKFAGGQVWHAAPDTPPFHVASHGRSRFLRAYVP